MPPGHIARMAIRKIARMGHPVLRKTAAPVMNPLDPEIQRLIDDMIETMIDANGAGLAAPQVYEPLRLVIFQAPGERSEAGEGEEAFDHTAPLTVLINPVIEVLDQDVQTGWEGCLSVPGLRGVVTRPSHIRYSGLDRAGEPFTRVARGFHARVVQHECDHLDGVLYPQRMQDLSLLLFESEIADFMAAHKGAGGA
jgi:peptide deformylase